MGHTKPIPATCARERKNGAAHSRSGAVVPFPLVSMGDKMLSDAFFLIFLLTTGAVASLTMLYISLPYAYTVTPQGGQGQDAHHGEYQRAFRNAA